MKTRAGGGQNRGLERSERPPGKVFGVTEFGESDLNTQREGKLWVQVESAIPAWKMTSTVALRPEGAWHQLAKQRNRKEDTGSGKE